MKIKTIADLSFDILLTRDLTWESFNLEFEDLAFYLEDTYNNRYSKIKDGNYKFIIPTMIEDELTYDEFEITSKNETLTSFIYLICIEIIKRSVINQYLFLDSFERINDFEYKILMNRDSY